MGCLQSKGKEENNQVQSEKDPPKTYSWDKREKVDPADFTIENISGQEVGRLPGTINGQQFIIQNCQSSKIYLFDHVNTITVDDCSDCVIFIGPTTGSLFLRDCRDCVVMAACGQFRTRDCCKMDIFLLCQTQPIIEASTKMRFGCFQAYYPQLEDHFTRSKISLFNNNWSNIHDFTPVEGETNWSSVSQNSALLEVFKLPETEDFKRFVQIWIVYPTLRGLCKVRFYLPRQYIPARNTRYAVNANSRAFSILRLNTTQYSRSFVPAMTRLWNDLPNGTVELDELQKFKLAVNIFMLNRLTVGLRLDINLSVVPYTLGSPVYGTQEATLIIFFNDASYKQRAINFITLLRTEVTNCVIQHSREVKMEVADAQRVFRTSEYNSVISQGPVIALLCLGTGVMDASSAIAAQVNSSSSSQTVYVTSDSNSSNQQIDNFFSYASMSMAL